MKTRYKIVAATLVVLALIPLSILTIQTRTPAQPAQIVGYSSTPVQGQHRSTPSIVQIFYPAEEHSVEPVLVGHNALFYGIWVRKDAPAVPGARPVVLLSHGSGGNAERLGWIAEKLVGRGMIVVAVNHLGTTSGDSDPFQTPMVWQRTADLSMALDSILSAPPMGLQPDPQRIAVLGFSLGGHSALGLSGASLSKQAFLDYCDTAGDALDCGWMRRAGVDFSAIDAVAYEQDLTDPRIKAAIAIDPALTPAMTPESLAAMRPEVLIINLGLPETLPLGLNAAKTAATIPRAQYLPIGGAHHFSFTAECSGLGWLVIGLAGEENICSDIGFRARGQIHAEVWDAVDKFLSATFNLAP